MREIGEFSGIVLCLILISACVHGHPTIYRYNEDKNLEPALVPVSSTVIPLAAYEVGYGWSNKGGAKKSEYPAETLITVKTKRRIEEKQPYTDTSTV